MTSKKKKDLAIVIGIYVLAYAIGVGCCLFVEGEMLRFFVFDIVATIVTFIFSVALHNSSVYDAYWSLTPMVMSVWLFVINKAFSFYQILFLLVFNLWSLRLTWNWVTVFTDFSYEDWRYRKFRDENNPYMWQFLNFTGIHMVPTIVVFLGMLPLFSIANQTMNAFSLLGDIIILIGVGLEFFADKQMHAFLEETEDMEKRPICRKGLWSYSRHPNYLGEITVWIGTFVTMIPYDPSKWYYAVGAFAVAILFNVVSIPMMEKRQLQRRPEYKEYQQDTSRLMIRPGKR